MKVIFDLDGTLRDVTHRRHLTQSPTKNWTEFFIQSEFDPPIKHVIYFLKDHVSKGHDVQIWSGCSDEVWGITEAWLRKNIGELWVDRGYTWSGQSERVDPAELLLHMRFALDYRPDYELKELWLKESIAHGWTPDLVYDDRQSVVDMWRRNGITCFQVAPGDFDKPQTAKRVRTPVLMLLIGPSGAGKSTFANSFAHPDMVVSSDKIRYQLFANYDKHPVSIKPEAYTPEGFAATFSAMRAIIKARIDSGLDTIIDATNLDRKSRMEYFKHLGITEDTIDDVCRVQYHIFDRPLETKLEDFLTKKPNHTNVDVIQRHHIKFQSSVSHALKGDGFSKIFVVDHRQK